MKPEFVIMVGNLFLKEFYDWQSSMTFTVNQHEAKRFTDEKSFKDVVAKMELYKVPFVLMKINIQAEVQVVVPNLVKETT